MNQKAKGLLWLAAAASLAAGAVLAFSLAVRQVPRPFEAWLGSKLLSFPRTSVCTNPPAEEALQQLIARIYPRTDEERANPIQVTVLRDGPVNAFASLGSRIYVYGTLIDHAESPEELAGVLAHEIGHVTERHVLQSLAFRVLTIPFWAVVAAHGAPVDPRVLDALTQLRFSRAQEYEADVDGLTRLRDSEIDTSGLARFFQRLSDNSLTPELLRDHPGAESRAKLAELYAVEHPRPVLSAEEWTKLRSICAVY